MDRKTIIFCLSVLAVLILGTGVAVAFLYRGEGADKDKKEKKIADDSRYLLLSAVPSDALMVACFSDITKVPETVFSNSSVKEKVQKSRMAVSMHYSGKLVPLYVIDMGKSKEMTSDDAMSLVELLRSENFYVELPDCSSAASGISEHSIVVASKSETLVKSSVRHLGRSISVMAAPGFAEASESVTGDDVLFISNSHAGNLLPAIFNKKYSSRSGFISRFADWTVFDMDFSNDAISFAGTAVSDADASDFVNVLKASSPSESSVADVLPSYTLFAASLPLGDMDAYIAAYRSYLDSRQALQKSLAHQKELGRKMGVTPADFMHMIDIEEVATASFAAGDDIETVLLMKAGTDDLDIVFKGTDVNSLKQYVPAVHSWPYPDFASSVFGELFIASDETCFTWMKGWIIVGSMDAVSSYVEGRTLEYTLSEYFVDASCEDLLSSRKSSFVSYFSFTADRSKLGSIFKAPFMKNWESEISSAEYVPAVMYAGMGKKGFTIEADILKLELQRTKAPAFERDTVVIVPKGPFEVKNSGTGKMNRFYQNSHLSICLSEEGKDLWGVPFKEPICGTAQNVDYFANGKLQIAFGAGSKIYLIDRLGRYVKGFPLDLGKPILIGPEVYDFNGSRRYNIMVLHKDNTVEMYNLKGEKPAAWKGIRPEETVKALPERISVGGSSFWVVRTSIQTLIYPFYGGEPLTSFTADQMIRPDSQVRVIDGTSVEVSCYDGKLRTVKLK